MKRYQSFVTHSFSPYTYKNCILEGKCKHTSLIREHRNILMHPILWWFLSTKDNHWVCYNQCIYWMLCHDKFCSTNYHSFWELTKLGAHNKRVQLVKTRPNFNLLIGSFLFYIYIFPNLLTTSVHTYLDTYVFILNKR